MRYAALFPGQGAQYVGMGEDLYKKHSIVRDLFDEASEVLNKDMTKLCFNSTETELKRTDNAQVSILTVSVASFYVFMKAYGIYPLICAGHSLGEYSALVCSEAITFSEALTLVSHRGKLMHEASLQNQGVMVSISQMDQATIENYCKEFSKGNFIAGISCINSSDQVVVSCNKEVVSSFVEQVEKVGGHATVLDVGGAFHSPLMLHAAKFFKEELMKIKFKSPIFPVISNLFGKPHNYDADHVEVLSRQILEPVDWLNTMKFIEGENVKYTIDFGPKTIVGNLVQRNYPLLKGLSVNSEKDMCLFQNELKEADKEKIKLLKLCCKIAVSTKNYTCNDMHSYQEYVLRPYQSICKTIDLAENNGISLSDEHVVEAIQILLQVFKMKGIGEEEVRNRLDSVLREIRFNHTCYAIFIINQLMKEINT